RGKADIVEQHDPERRHARDMRDRRHHGGEDEQRPAARHRSVSLFLNRGRGERAQHQHGDDQGEDDDFLEVGGVERGERLDAADDQRRDC
ncbi:hypothetical protein LTR94_036925, partial [Friedmanniomyces endolithicus]